MNYAKILLTDNKPQPTQNPPKEVRTSETRKDKKCNCTRKKTNAI